MESRDGWRLSTIEICHLSQDSFRLREHNQKTVDELVDDAEDKLFSDILHNEEHVKTVSSEAPHTKYFRPRHNNLTPCTENYCMTYRYFCCLSLTIVSWSGITGHNLTPQKRDNNYTSHYQTPTTSLRTKFNLELASVPVLGGCNVHFNSLQYYCYCLWWYKFVDTHLYHSRQWFNIRKVYNRTRLRHENVF